MTETRIVFGLGQTAALRRHDRNRRPVQPCATCSGKRDVGVVDRDLGFCGDCLERSRIVDDDDIGGES
jgi:hypothetical protein